MLRASDCGDVLSTLGGFGGFLKQPLVASIVRNCELYRQAGSLEIDTLVHVWVATPCTASSGQQGPDEWLPNITMKASLPHWSTQNPGTCYVGTDLCCEYVVRVTYSLYVCISIIFLAAQAMLAHS